jgi:hypothetical protein
MVLRQVQFELVDFSWVLHPKVEIFFHNDPLWLAHHKKKFETLNTPLIEVFIFK